MLFVVFCLCALLWLENMILFFILFLFFSPSHVLFDSACRSGLEQDDMRILYKYLTTSLFPRHSEPEVRMCEQKSEGIIDKRVCKGKYTKQFLRSGKGGMTVAWWEKDCNL